MDNLSERSDFKYPTLADKKKKKDALKKFKNITMIIEVILIFLMINLICSQMIIGMDIYSQYSLVKGSFFYEALLYYIRNLDFKFEIKEFTADGCPSDMKKIVFQKVSYLKGVCLQSDASTEGYNFYYENKTACEMDTLNMDTSQTINYWNGMYYCKRSHSGNDIKFYFLGNASDCEDGDIKCGTYWGYSFCMHIIDKVNIHETTCPFMNVYGLFDGPVPEGLSTQEFKINGRKFKLIRNVSDYLVGFYYSFRLSYGDLNFSYANSTLNTTFISYYREAYINFAVSKRFSLLPIDLGNDENKGFLINYFNPVIIQSVKSLGPINIMDRPKSSFSVRLKFNFLPRPNCLPFFEKTKDNKNYFIENFKLFVNHIDISGPKFIGFTIIEIIYTSIFYIYYRGFLILKSITSKPNPLDEENEEISAYTKFIFSFMLLFIKFFNNFIQSQNIQENIDFSYNMNVNECFNWDHDPYMYNSLKYYHDQVIPLNDLTKMTLLLVFVQVFLLVVYLMIRKFYFIKKHNFAEFVELYKIGLKNKREMRDSKKTSSFKKEL
jgi:hypothetical protein